MAATTTFDLAVQSFQELGYEFLATVLGFSSSQTSLTACAVEPAVSDQGKLQTYFFLNPWETFDESRNIPPECAGMDWTVILFLAGIILVWFWVPRWILYAPWLARQTKGNPDVTDFDRKINVQQTALLSQFILSAIFAFRILWSKEWLFSRQDRSYQVDLVDADFKFYYLIYAARMIAEFSSLFLEERKGNHFWAPCYHHLVTFGLVVGSGYMGYTRFGGILMFFFDWADIPLLSCRLLKMLSRKPGDVYARWSLRMWIVLLACVDGIPFPLVSLLLLLAAVQSYWLYALFQSIKERAKAIKEARKKAAEEAKKKA